MLRCEIAAAANPALGAQDACGWSCAHAAAVTARQGSTDARARAALMRARACSASSASAGGAGPAAPGAAPPASPAAAGAAAPPPPPSPRAAAAAAARRVRRCGRGRAPPPSATSFSASLRISSGMRSSSAPCTASAPSHAASSAWPPRPPALSRARAAPKSELPACVAWEVVRVPLSAPPRARLRRVYAQRAGQHGYECRSPSQSAPKHRLLWLRCSTRRGLPAHAPL